MIAFFAIAWALTWGLDAPLALAWSRGEQPPTIAVAMAALSAFGPTLAAIAMGARRFGPWKAAPGWVLAALLLPLAANLTATAIEVLLGGHPTVWLHSPANADQVAAMVVFPIGEELGWRGFAYPRMAERLGPVAGALVLGLGWALWHAGMGVSPEDGHYDFVALGTLAVTLPLWSVVYAWLSERTGGSLLVALALHAGGHLDNFGHIPEDQVRLRIVGVVVAAVLAGAAALHLTRRRR